MLQHVIDVDLTGMGRNVHKRRFDPSCKMGVINHLDGSGGLIKDHGDVTSDAITYAFASAVART